MAESELAAVTMGHGGRTLGPVASAQAAQLAQRQAQQCRSFLRRRRPGLEVVEYRETRLFLEGQFHLFSHKLAFPPWPGREGGRNS